MRTGVPHWNVICRWAFCLSLKQASPPAPLDIQGDSNVELTWQVFGGDVNEIYLALLKECGEHDGLYFRMTSWPASPACTCTEESAPRLLRRRSGRSAIRSDSPARKVAAMRDRPVRVSPA